MTGWHRRGGGGGRAEQSTEKAWAPTCQPRSCSPKTRSAAWEDCQGTIPMWNSSLFAALLLALVGQSSATWQLEQLERLDRNETCSMEDASLNIGTSRAHFMVAVAPNANIVYVWHLTLWSVESRGSKMQRSVGRSSSQMKKNVARSGLQMQKPVAQMWWQVRRNAGKNIKKWWGASKKENRVDHFFPMTIFSVVINNGWLVVWNLFLFFHILGISSSQLTNSIIFQRGRYTTNHLFSTIVYHVIHLLIVIISVIITIY